MAMATTAEVLHDGVKNVIMQFTGISDGTNETNVVKVDISELNPRPLSVKVQNIQYDVSGGFVRLAWAADVPIVIADVTGPDSICYEKFGGLFNREDANNPTGDIVFSTMGFEAGSNYQIKLEMTKKYP